MDAAYALAKNLATVKYDDIPPNIVDITKKQIMDILGVMLGGSSRPGVKELAEIIRDWGGKEESTVLCFDFKVPAPNAAQVNATMGHALDYDDTGEGPTHPSVVIVPSCLAMAERQGGISGREFIASVALGVDVMGRLGRAFRAGMKTTPVAGHPGAGWHLTALYGYLAAAGVAGRLMGLDEERIHNALGIAYHQCSGNGQCVTEGALTKRMGPGFSARGGIVAALMAEKGITGAKECLEGEVGLYNLYHKGEYDAGALTEDIGKSYAGINVTMKPYPCCKGTHNYVDLASAMLDKYGIKADAIKEIVIYCRDAGYFLLHPLEKRSRPENPVDSQFSIPWAVAAVFARGRAGVGEFTDDAIKSQDVLDVSMKIRVEVDDGLKKSKDMDPAKIGVTMKNGQTHVMQADTAAEDSEKPTPFSTYERKFRDCAAFSIKPLPDRKIGEIIQSIHRLEEFKDIRQFVEMLS